MEVRFGRLRLSNQTIWLPQVVPQMIPSILTEDDIPGASLAGRNPLSLKNEELRFWLRCHGDSLKGLKTKALLVKW